MKILIELKNINRMDDYLGVDELILNTQYSMSPNPIYSKKEELEYIYNWCHKNNKKIIYRIDSIVSETNLKDVLNFINEHLEFNFIYTDFAIFTYFKTLNRLNQLYYFAQTYLVNAADIEYYTSKQVKCLMSNELSLKEIQLIINGEKNNLIGVLAYGYFPIFYTKRKLLTLYKEYIEGKYEHHLQIDKNKVYDLKEELREEHYKIEELEDATLICSCHKMFIDKDFDLNQLHFIYLSNYYINDDENKIIIEFYENYKKNGIQSLKDFTEEPIQDLFKSFLYKVNEIL